MPGQGGVAAEPPLSLSAGVNLEASPAHSAQRTEGPIQKGPGLNSPSPVSWDALTSGLSPEPLFQQPPHTLFLESLRLVLKALPRCGPGKHPHRTQLAHWSPGWHAQSLPDTAGGQHT